MGSSSINFRIIAASLIGSSIEWFDYFLYGTLAALVFGKLFFPDHDPSISLMLSYLTFSMSFFVRPLGGLLFAHFGDNFGRKKSLVATLTLMGVATAGIGVLPTYAQAGLAAPVLLILLRLIQGIGLGGEWGGAMLLSYEHALHGSKNLAASFPQAGVTIGMLLATLTVGLLSLLPASAFFVWGWRVPFLISVLLVMFGLWIRHDVAETPEFEAAQRLPREPGPPVAKLLRSHWREVLAAIAAKAVETGPFYIFSVFVLSYATEHLGYSRISVLNSITVGALIATVTIPVYGALADRIGAKRLFLAGTTLMLLATVPYFLLLQLRHWTAVLAATVLLFGIIWPMITCVLGSILSGSFKADVRYSGVTLGYQLGAALIGGTSPLIAEALLAQSHGQWQPIAAYMAATALLSLLGVGMGYRPGAGPAAGAATVEARR